MSIRKHFITIKRHRREVRKACFKCGLYWRGLVHDLSKYSYVEFFENAKYYVEGRSPISNCRAQTGKSMAWLNHKAKNRHHPEYWIDNDNYVLMPYKYAVESACDYIAAGKTYTKNYSNSEPYEYWSRKKENFKVNKKIYAFYEKVFSDLEKNGEDAILNKKYMIKTYYDCIEDQKNG